MFPASIEKISGQFIRLLKEYAGENLHAVYLTGSIALHDYHPGKSDLDFVVIFKNNLQTGSLPRLEVIHKHMAAAHRRPALNGCYFGLDEICDPRLTKIPAYYHDGKLRINVAANLFQELLCELRQNAICLYGPPASTLDLPFSKEKLMKELHENINTYWKDWEETHSRLFSYKGMQLFCFACLSEWALLGMARILYTLKTGRITSKEKAGEYCLSMLPHALASAMKDAISCRRGEIADLNPSLSRFRNTIKCMKFLRDESQGPDLI